MNIPKWVSAVFAALLAAGPLGPIAAVAQTTATTPLQPMQSMQPESVEESVTRPPGTGAKIGAGVLNVVYRARQGNHLYAPGPSSPGRSCSRPSERPIARPPPSSTKDAVEPGF